MKAQRINFTNPINGSATVGFAVNLNDGRVLVRAIIDKVIESIILTAKETENRFTLAGDIFNISLKKFEKWQTQIRPE